MSNKEILRLIAGFRRFRERYFSADNNVYEKLSSSGQSPKILMIACSDSRVDPAIITDAEPGELFTVRNVANLVPPCEVSEGYHGVSSAIEFAVVNLKVDYVIILGHRQCGGIQALMTGNTGGPDSYIGKWMRIAEGAKERVLAKHPGANDETLCIACEMESIVTSIENIKTFPFVQQAIAERSMTIMGAYFDLERGHMYEYDPPTRSFRQLDV